MREILDYLKAKTAAYAELPLYEFLRDSRIDARDRLAFVPGIAHFVMTFADLYALVLREEPARDRFQELVNAHTYEDGDHWKWYLADLTTLQFDSSTTFSNALRYLWSDESVRIRTLSYDICRLGLGADSRTKLVLVQCIEAVGAVSLEYAAPLGREVGSRLGKKLVYFGPHHFETESKHTLEDREVAAWLEGVELSQSDREDARRVIDAAFQSFTKFADAVLSLAKNAQAIR